MAELKSGKMPLKTREDLDNLVLEITRVQKTLDFVPG